jgi:chaperone modulatory protein CbpM
MMRIDDVASRCRVSRVVLTAWIGQCWVRPREADGGYLFDEADVARVDLLRDLSQGLDIDDEAMPLVLSLLDQLYAARRVLAGVNDALRELPAPLREEVRRRLRLERG